MTAQLGRKFGELDKRNLGSGLTLLLLLVASTSAVAQTCVQPPSGIIVWWPFDETSGPIVNDIGGSHPGAYFGAPTPAIGEVGGAVHFDGSGSFVGVADSDLWAFGLQSFSIELWAKFDTPGGGTLHHPSHIFIGSDDGPGDINKFFFALGGGFLNFHINSPTLGPKFFPLAPFSPQVGLWYHLAVTRNGSLYTVFVDGSPIGSAINSDPIPNANASLTIGQAESLGFMHGSLDEVSVYDRALTETEIRSIFQAGNAGKCKDWQNSSATISPSSGGDLGPVTVRIKGSGFSTGSIVKLQKTGSSDIMGGPVSVAEDGHTIEATLDLKNREKGSWDVVISKEGVVQVKLDNGFKVVSGVPARLWVDIIGRGAIRRGQDASFVVMFGNRGNVDVRNVVIWISVPHGLDIKIEAPYLQELGPTPEDPPNPVEGRDYYWLLTDRLAAGAINSVSFSVNSLNPGQIAIGSGIFDATPILKTRLARLEHASRSLVAKIEVPSPGDLVFKGDDPGDPFPTGHVGIYVGDIPPDDPLHAVCQTKCVVDFVPADRNKTIGMVRLTSLDPQSDPKREWDHYNVRRGSGRPPGLRDDQAKDAAQAAKNYFRTYRDALLPFLVPPSAGHDDCVSKVDSFYRAVGYSLPWTDWSSPPALYEFVTGKLWPGLVYNVYRLLRTSAEIFFPESSLLVETVFAIVVNVVTSVDPNEKVGSQGVTTQHFQSGAEPMRYAILFENLNSATTAARDIWIIDHLDPEKLDLATLSFGTISFSHSRLEVPKATTGFATIIDLRPDQEIIVKVEASLNAGTGLLTWHLVALDPNTGMPPEDPFIGFLPPNVHPPEGEGRVFFTIMPREDLVTDAEIRNQATIVFDNNTPILTNEWLNTLDSAVPESHCLWLTASQKDPSFLVRWTGTDAGSGIKDYTIFVSVDNGSFSIWLSHTTDTSATFTGVAGKSYSFYSMARDQVGNVEAAHQTADTTTQVLVNHPPIALCKSITIPTDVVCAAQVVTPQQFDAGSHDPDGDPVALSVTPSGPYSLGETPVTLTVKDGRGASGSCMVTVKIEDRLAPVISCNNPPVILPPPLKPMSFKASATDNCGVTSLKAVTYTCYKIDKQGRRIDQSKTCGARLNGDTMTISRPIDLLNDIGDNIDWTVVATDKGGNTVTQNCHLVLGLAR